MALTSERGQPAVGDLDALLLGELLERLAVGGIDRGDELGPERVDVGDVRQVVLDGDVGAEERAQADGQAGQREDKEGAEDRALLEFVDLDLQAGDLHGRLQAIIAKRPPHDKGGVMGTRTGVHVPMKAPSTGTGTGTCTLGTCPHERHEPGRGNRDGDMYPGYVSPSGRLLERYNRGSTSAQMARATARGSPRPSMWTNSGPSKLRKSGGRYRRGSTSRPDGPGDGRGGRPAVDMDEFRPFEAPEDLADPDEVVLALEELVPGLAAADASQPGPGVDVEDDDDVGRDGEGLVDPADPPHVTPLAPW